MRDIDLLFKQEGDQFLAHLHVYADNLELNDVSPEYLSEDEMNMLARFCCDFAKAYGNRYYHINHTIPKWLELKLHSERVIKPAYFIK